MSESQESPSPREMGSASLGAAWAVILGGAAGPLAPVAAALITPLSTRMMELIFSEWGRTSNIVTAAAIQASGLGPDEFCGILGGDPGSDGTGAADPLGGVNLRK